MEFREKNNKPLGVNVNLNVLFALLWEELGLL